MNFFCTKTPNVHFTFSFISLLFSLFLFFFNYILIPSTSTLLLCAVYNTLTLCDFPLFFLFLISDLKKEKKKPFALPYKYYISAVCISFFFPVGVFEHDKNTNQFYALKTNKNTLYFIATN